MRIWPIAALILGTAAPLFADNKGLTADEVQAQLKPISSEIERCYMERTAEVRGAGHLAVVLDVSKEGIVEKVGVKTPGLTTKVAKEIDGCVRAVLTPVNFPARKTFTNATVPYFFQHTAAPNSGPQLSCWNPNGCHVAK